MKNHPKTIPNHSSSDGPGHRPPLGAWEIPWKCPRADRGRHPMPGDSTDSTRTTKSRESVWIGGSVKKHEK